MKSANQILSEHGIDTMKLNDGFNTQLFHAMERYAEQFKSAPVDDGVNVMPNGDGIAMNKIKYEQEKYHYDCGASSRQPEIEALKERLEIEKRFSAEAADVVVELNEQNALLKKRVEELEKSNEILKRIYRSA